MKLLLINLVFSVLFYKDAFGAESKIVGGVPAAVGQFPYQAVLEMKSTGFVFCGASVIEPNYVLTAAHCVYESYDNDQSYEVISPDKIRVKAGGIKEEHLTPFDVEWIIPHDCYRPTVIDTECDIAVIKVLGNFSYFNNIDTIELGSEQVPDETECTVSGYGTTSFEGPTSTKLLFTNVEIINHEECANKYAALGIVITDRMICAGKNNKDSCQGDSGGPLVCDDRLDGIVSFGIGCGNDFPGIYTNVSSYLDWIEEALNRSSAPNVFNRVYVSIILVVSTVFVLF